MASNEYNRKYYLEHQEELKKRSKKRYHDNKDNLDRDVLKAYHAAYYQKHKADWNKRTPEENSRRNAARRDRYANDEEYRDATRQKVKEYQTNHPHIRKAQRIRKFGITLDEFNSMLVRQDGKCAVCGYSEMSDKNFFPVVDHDHLTGKVRGLLCMNCNMGIGKFKDDISRLKSAINYLEGFNG